jgi:hypothetical protein
MTVRAKMVVTEIKKHRYGGKSAHSITLEPVTGNGSDENKRFWEATPTGKVEMCCINEEAAKQFELGQECYVDFIPI